MRWDATPLEQGCIRFAFTAAWAFLAWFAATGGGAV